MNFDLSRRDLFITLFCFFAAYTGFKVLPDIWFWKQNETWGDGFCGETTLNGEAWATGEVIIWSIGFESKDEYWFNTGWFLEFLISGSIFEVCLTSAMLWFLGEKALSPLLRPPKLTLFWIPPLAAWRLELDAWLLVLTASRIFSFFKKFSILCDCSCYRIMALLMGESSFWSCREDWLLCLWILVVLIENWLASLLSF